jgi:hypothetical protein
MTNTGTNLFGIALDELGNVLARIDESRIDAACAMLAGAGRIAQAIPLSWAPGRRRSGTAQSFIARVPNHP